jgi:alkyl sulfatase BDS1-like metallo-beta-lactamase superfamily hydrolase
MKAIKVGDFIEVLATKIVPENLMDENFKINFGVGSEEFAITVRSGVLAREDGFSNEASSTLKFDNKGSMVAVLGGAVSPDDAITNGTLKIDGDTSLDLLPIKGYIHAKAFNML